MYGVFLYFATFPYGVSGQLWYLIVSIYGVPRGFWGSGENGYLFSGSWGALVIILGELGSKLIIFGI